MNILITSAAYIDTEMAAEFGRLPPAFLPLGTERLIQHQVRSMEALGGTVWLSLPETFAMAKSDRETLDRMGVRVIEVAEGLSLGRSIQYCLSQIRDGDGSDAPLTIVHGDTLVELTGDFPRGNACVVAAADQRYAWGRAFVEGGRLVGASNERGGTSDTVLVGYFSFGSAQSLETALVQSNGDFLTALSRLALQGDMRAEPCARWSDFGHLQTYYQSRAAYASARSFNALRITGGIVYKTSEARRKIEAEADWFAAIPTKLQPYTARLVGSGLDEAGHWHYATEYEYLPSLQELFVFGDLPQDAWRDILESCCRCLEGFRSVEVPGAPTNALQLLAQDKTRNRIEQFERQSGLDLSCDARLDGRAMPSPRQIAEEMIARIAGATPQPATIMHGDFCCSNILYDSRTGRVRVIDPRGTLDGVHSTIGGDSRYDMAKLSHSVVGLYDLIIAGKLRATRSGAMDFSFPRHPPTADYNRMVQAFLKMGIRGVTFGDDVIMANMILLFVSMLPLHADRPDRQMTFLANAIWLYNTYFARG